MICLLQQVDISLFAHLLIASINRLQESASCPDICKLLISAQTSARIPFISRHLLPYYFPLDLSSQSYH